MNSKSRWARLARNWLVAFVDPHRVRGLASFPRYVWDWWRYTRLTERGAIRWTESYPCLTDWTPQTPFDAHYFYQSGWAARKLTQDAPRWHVDVGSSSLFIGMVSALVPTIFVDYRPLQVKIARLTPLAGNLLALPLATGSVPSLSCLHVIEHIGLGRYGDALDREGSVRAAQELTRVLAPGGRLLLSTLIGRERVEFNAHRVFAPTTVLAMFSELTFCEVALVDDDRNFHAAAELAEASGFEYACGMFEFVKSNEDSLRSQPIQLW